MKMILFLFLVISASSAYLGCELKDDKDEDCQKDYEEVLAGQSLLCLNNNYLTESGYTDYEDCMSLNSKLIMIGANDCEAKNRR